jgi:hypothetical protein
MKVVEKIKNSFGLKILLKKTFSNYQHLLAYKIPVWVQSCLIALEALRDRILFDLKLGKQAPGYKAAQKALNRFIAELTHLAKNL